MTTSWSETIRRKIWLSEIELRRDGRSNYRLSALASKIVGDKLPGIERRRLFESAMRGRHSKRLPRGLSLAQAVELIPGFEGTAAVYESPIWDILDLKERTAWDISQLAEDELARCSLTRDLPEDYWLSHTLEQFAVDYERAVEAGLRGLTAVRQLSLLATLCAEACCCGETVILDRLRARFDDAVQINPFGRQIIGADGFESYLRVLHAVCHPHLSAAVKAGERSDVAFRARQILLPSSQSFKGSGPLSV